MALSRETSSTSAAMRPLRATKKSMTLGREVRRAAVPLFFILPAVAFAAVFLYYPTVSGLYHAFFDWDGASPPDFIGLSNFQEMWGDPVMRIAFANMVKLTIFAVATALTVPLFVAKVINSLRSPRVQYLCRVGFVVPLVVPQVVLILIWGFFYEPTDGLLNRLLIAVHLRGLTQAWLGDPKLALYCIMFMTFPWVNGFGLLIYTAGLQAIPGELLEAAALDGANAWRRFWRIEIPLILGQIRLLVVLAVIGGIQNFTQVLILTNGGPGQATTVPGLYLYQEITSDQRFGYASAIALVLFFITLLVTIVNLKFIRPSTDFEGAAV